MKKCYITAVLCMYTVAPVRAMHNQELMQELPSITATQKTLRATYQKYLKNQLEEYKTTGSVDLTTLVKMGGLFQNIREGYALYPKDLIADDIIDTTDSNGNNFIHIAAERDDVKMVGDLSGMRSRTTALSNKAGQTPLDLCILKFLSDAADKNKAKQMLETILYRAAHISRSSDEHKTYLEGALKKVISLQLAYKKQSKDLDVPLKLLARLVDFHVSDDKHQEVVSLFYQQATDEVTGNTFTHVLVELGYADELYEWIQQKRISFAKNKAGDTPDALALSNYLPYLELPASIDSFKEEFNRKRCCLFMLLNYLKIIGKQSCLMSFKQCCSVHKIGDAKKDDEGTEGSEDQV